MSLIGVYPNPLEMTREELIEYVYFIESQAVVKECDLADEIKHLKSIIKNQKELEN